MLKKLSDVAAAGGRKPWPHWRTGGLVDFKHVTLVVDDDTAASFNCSPIIFSWNPKGEALVQRRGPGFQAYIVHVFPRRNDPT